MGNHRACRQPAGRAGLARIGYELTLRDIDEAGQVLNAALDGGVNFLDTSACYDISEELIGRTISHRRGEFILATKCGHVTGGASSPSEKHGWRVFGGMMGPVQ